MRLSLEAVNCYRTINSYSINIVPHLNGEKKKPPNPLLSRSATCISLFIKMQSWITMILLQLLLLPVTFKTPGENPAPWFFLLEL